MEQASGEERLMTEVVGAAGSELGIAAGAGPYAVTKAVAFHRLG